MIVDYSTLFATREELTDFFLLDIEEQDAVLALAASEGRAGLTFACRLARKDQPCPEDAPNA